ncbi:MAG TPA: DUF896 domain-containing protein [Candidatus Eisenbergiella merdipullorum]|uniref:UPF0291 protein H9717_12425 n=1 Tax=Candidatus Eisenbergiella merdipullorum TaxID=2838553 RepID=A0A9D2L0Q0_9FIRM|nr:DUF896 domain-containing protein [Candidatus Eisenbergiella merdipullorum]
MDEKIKRINELYHKSKKEGLSAAEKEEQASLRLDYVNSVKANLRAQLNNINIQNEDGSITNLGKEHASKGSGHAQ